MKSLIFSRKALLNYFYVGGLIVIVLSIRFALWMSTKSLWGDEWYTIVAARKTISEIICGEIFTLNHPPNYHFLVSLWIRAFGVSELSFRGMSHFMNISMVLASFAMAKEMFNKKVAMLTAFMVGVCPYFLHLSNEIRSYSTLAFFSTTATYFFFKAQNDPLHVAWKFAYSVFAVLTIYTEHYGWFWLFGITTYLIFKLLTERKYEKKWIWIQSLVFLIGMPSVLLIIYQAVYDEGILVRTKLMPYRSLLEMAKKSFGIYWHFSCGPIYSMLPAKRVMDIAKHSLPFWISFVLTLSMLTLCLKALVALFQKQKSVFVLSVTTIFFPVFFLLITYPIRLDARYLCWAVPPFFALVAYAVVTIRNSNLRKLIIGSFLICSLIADVYMIRIPTDPMHKEDYRGMLKYSFEHSGKNDAISGVGLPTTYYLTRIGIEPNGTYYDNLQDILNAVQSTQFDQIWTMHYINMKPEITGQILTEIDSLFLPFNYVRKGHLMRFGGPDALTAIQIYVPSPKFREAIN